MLFQVKKGTGKKASDNKENRLSHRILNPFWMIMLTGAIWIQCRESALRQTRPAEHFMRDLRKKIQMWLQAEMGNCKVSVIMERKDVLVIDVTEEIWGGGRQKQRERMRMHSEASIVGQRSG